MVAKISLFLIVALIGPVAQVVQAAEPASATEKTMPPPAEAEQACGKKLAPLCRAKHSLRRLKDGRILVVAGKYANGTAAEDVIVFDPIKKEFKSQQKIPNEMGFNDGAVGFKLSEKVLAFSNRLQEQDGTAKDSYSSAKVYPVSIIYWNADTNSLSDGKASFYSVTTVAGHSTLRKKAETKVLHFRGHESARGCERKDDLDECHLIYQIDAYALKLDGNSTENMFPSAYLSGSELTDPSPSTEKAELLGALKRARMQFDATSFSDGRLFIAGGQEQDGAGKLSIPETAEFFLPGKGWFETAPIPAPGKFLKTFSLSEDEALVVDVSTGKAFTWSFKARAWKPAFQAGGEISRGNMHSSGSFTGLVKNGASEKLFLWRSGNGNLEFLESKLPFNAGTGLVELADGKILETQLGGVAIWDLKAKQQAVLKE